MSAPRFLIVKFSAIGDCVMAVPVASAIRRTHPDAFVAWAVASRCSAVLDTDQLLDLRYVIPRERWKNRAGSWHQQYLHFSRLRAFKFDFGMDLQGHSKTALCLRIAGAKTRVATRATDAFTRCLNPVAPGERLQQHTVERNMQVLKSLGEFDTDGAPIMPEVSSYCPALKKDAGSLDRLITIAVSAGHPKKQYPVERWAEVAKILSGRGFRVAFLGGSGDMCPSVPGTTDWVGKLPLEQSMAAVALSAVHLASDTGTGHMAAAYGTPVVSVFGYTKSWQFRPYSDNSIVLDAGKTMDRVAPEQVADAALGLVRTGAACVS